MNTKDIVVHAATLAGGIAVGYAVGHILQKRKYERLIEEEIDSVREAFAPFRKDGLYSTVEGAVEARIGNPFRTSADFDDEDIQEDNT